MITEFTSEELMELSAIAVSRPPGFRDFSKDYYVDEDGVGKLREREEKNDSTTRRQLPDIQG